MIVVTGATGTVGRELVDLLLAADQPVTAVTRNPATVALPEQVRVIAGNPSEPATLTEAWTGATRLFVNPTAVGPALPELLTAAAQHGVRHVVLLSGAAVAMGDAIPGLARRFAGLEAAVRASGLEWTFLRPGEFAANALNWAPQIRATDVVRAAHAKAAGTPIHERDIAAVAARALTEDGHTGQSYLMTGPAVLTNEEKARQIGTAIGRDVIFQEITPDEARAAMVAHGTPEDIADSVLRFQADSVDHPAPISPVVEQLLGRPALPFARWAADNAAAFQP